MEYLKELNPVQREAVENINGASLVIAGAGSGKTRVLTYRIAHLLNQGVRAYSILALTFTNKAAREMKERIGKVVGPEQAQSLWMGTFHSTFSKILRYESEHLGFDSNFTIYDTQDSRNLLRAIIKEMRLDDKVYKANEVLNRISSAKNNLVTANAYAQNANIQKIDASNRRPLIFEIYKKYSQRCRQANAMDFDDLLLQTNILFKTKPDILAKYQDKFKYVLVDEYQDTNYSQYLIVSWC
jgi:ATP-dependent DNA helicase UvrD/PcrA